jgi:hypothetical protein
MLVRHMITFAVLKRRADSVLNVAGISFANDQQPTTQRFVD